jgi:hypothetical protein
MASLVDSSPPTSSKLRRDPRTGQQAAARSFGRTCTRCPRGRSPAPPGWPRRRLADAPRSVSPSARPPARAGLQARLTEAELHLLLRHALAAAVVLQLRQPLAGLLCPAARDTCAATARPTSPAARARAHAHQTAPGPACGPRTCSSPSRRSLRGPRSPHEHRRARRDAPVATVMMATEVQMLRAPPPSDMRAQNVRPPKC